jgi:large subunit ribosomal protein L22
MKRIRPAPMGRAYRYQRRLTHIVLSVAEREAASGLVTKVEEPAAAEPAKAEKSKKGVTAAGKAKAAAPKAATKAAEKKAAPKKSAKKK